MLKKHSQKYFHWWYDLHYTWTVISTNYHSVYMQVISTNYIVKLTMIWNSYW